VALPAAAESAAYAGQHGQVLKQGSVVAPGVAAVPEALRPALAALYCAQQSALRVGDLGSHMPQHGSAPVILEGPLARNAAFSVAMADALPERTVLRSVDELEGTARGAWMLAHWNEAAAAWDASPLRRVDRRDA
jgi:L-fuculokinase